ncbi:MAG: nitrite/sulfite reductase, partial [Oscillospiraceae bacterium]|nr:nitrite/sulfite reductase [Oscillospiraceae bacterium]
MDEKLKKQIEEFREKTEQFSKGEINVSEYKSFSGKFGSYAQRGAKAGMLRLRIAGGQISKEKLKFLIDLCEKYGINHIHCTT